MGEIEKRVIGMAKLRIVPFLIARYLFHAHAKRLQQANALLRHDIPRDFPGGAANAQNLSGEVSQWRE